MLDVLGRSLEFLLKILPPSRLRGLPEPKRQISERFGTEILATLKNLGFS